jgi:hypothetical protein
MPNPERWQDGNHGQCNRWRTDRLSAELEDAVPYTALEYLEASASVAVHQAPIGALFVARGFNPAAEVLYTFKAINLSLPIVLWYHLW